LAGLVVAEIAGLAVYQTGSLPAARRAWRNIISAALGAGSPGSG
jgi:hypothetical protein